MAGHKGASRVPHLGGNNEEGRLRRELPSDLSQVSAVNVGDVMHSWASLAIGLECFRHHKGSLGSGGGG